MLYHVFELIPSLCLSLIPFFYHHEDMAIYISSILDHGPICTVDLAMPEVDGTAASREPHTLIKTTPPEDMPNSDGRNFIFSYILNSLRLRWEKPSDDFRIHLARQQRPSGWAHIKIMGRFKEFLRILQNKNPKPATPGGTPGLTPNVSRPPSALEMPPNSTAIVPLYMYPLDESTWEPLHKA